MRKITDDDLTLLYYGEHDDPKLAACVAESEELSARYDALCRELQLADTYAPPARGEDYGAEVWQRISPRLGSGSEKHAGWFKSLLTAVSRPRFSLATALSMLVVAVLAFTLGRNGVQDNTAVPGAPLDDTAAAIAAIDPGRLLNHSVSTHLEQVDIILTQFANSDETGINETEYATDMLVANRLYRQAAASQGNHRLAAFLAELEPLLIEMAYEAQAGSPATRERMQREVNDGLLFRVRVMNKQLSKTGISV